MSGRIAITPEELDELARQLDQAGGQVQDLLQQMGRQVEPVASAWEGESRARFVELWSEWQRGAGSVHEALMGIAQLTRHAADTFRQADQQAIR
jgi:WXG100 family type VII secretion target